MSSDIFRALKGRNFRLYLAGQGISLIGTWMQQIGMSWLVYRLTHSALLLGAVAFINQIPTFFLSPVAGAWADRTDRHRLIRITQALLMLQAGLLAWLTMTNRVQVWHIVGLGLFFGLINAADIPARQSFITQMVDRREDIPNAIALNASMVNVTRLIGPSLAGLVVGGYGEAWCFFFNSFSFLAMLIALSLMHVVKPEARVNPRPLWHDLKEGIRYAVRHPGIRRTLTLLALISLLGTSFSTLMPMFATDIFHGDAHTLGFLTSASGAGALTAALYMMSLRNHRHLNRHITAAAMAFSTALLFFGFTSWFLLALALLYCAGFGMMAMMGLSNTLLQTETDESKRGRIMSFYVMCLIGVSPIGALLAGSVAHWIGAPHTVTLSGFSCLACAYWYRRRHQRDEHALKIEK